MLIDYTASDYRIVTFASLSIVQHVQKKAIQTLKNVNDCFFNKNSQRMQSLKCADGCQ